MLFANDIEAGLLSEEVNSGVVVFVYVYTDVLLTLLCSRSLSQEEDELDLSSPSESNKRDEKCGMPHW